MASFRSLLNLQTCPTSIKRDENAKIASPSLSSLSSLSRVHPHPSGWFVVSIQHPWQLHWWENSSTNKEYILICLLVLHTIRNVIIEDYAICTIWFLDWLWLLTGIIFNTHVTKCHTFKIIWNGWTKRRNEVSGKAFSTNFDTVSSLWQPPKPAQAGQPAQAMLTEAKNLFDPLNPRQKMTPIQGQTPRIPMKNKRVKHHRFTVLVYTIYRIYGFISKTVYFPYIRNPDRIYILSVHI